MPAYKFLALRSDGSEYRGVTEGDSDRQVRQWLRNQGFNPVEVSATEKQVNKQISLSRSKRIPLADLALITRQFATLISSGMPVEEALRGVAEQTEKTKIKEILLSVRSHILEGHSLAQALAQFPQTFTPLYRATINAGEQTGHLDLVLNRLAEYIENQQQMRQKITQALVYPSLMTAVSLSIVTFLLIYVVPKIISVFETTGQSLPGITTFLIGLSLVIKSYGIYLLIFFIIAGYSWYRLLRREHIRKRWHAFLLKIPLIGFIIQAINTARFSRTLGILSSSGIPILESMQVACALITTLPIKDAVQLAAFKISEGMHIHNALKQTQYFPPMAIHLIANGESSGRLEAMLEHAANTQDQEVKRLIDMSLTLFEPLIILFMGAIVLFIVLAILLPIFELDQLTG